MIIPPPFTHVFRTAFVILFGHMFVTGIPNGWSNGKCTKKGPNANILERLKRREKTVDKVSNVKIQH